MKKEQLKNLKDILCTYYKEKPRKLKPQSQQLDLSTFRL